MSLYKLGRYEPGDPGCSVGEGDAPFRLLYASTPHETSERVRWGAGDGTGARGLEPVAVTGSPTQLALESFGYDTDALAREPAELSWAELFNRAWAGRVALTDDPVAGFQQAALAASSAGLLDVASPARPTLEELDGLTRILLELQRAGHFRAFPSTFDESVDLIAGKEVVLEPLSPPALGLLQASGFPVRQAAPGEGYRAWAGLLFLSREALRDPSRLQACYDYAAWWLSGVPGSLLMRQGYVNAALQTSLEIGTVSQDEWDYWIGGEPAGSDLATPFGEGSITTGDRLDGGSLEARACSISTWLSSFGENAGHAAERWATVVER
jgi:putative spermidine/putrescine transport system substrate-binding protein